MKGLILGIVTIAGMYSLINEPKKYGSICMKLNIIILLLAAIYARS